MAAIACSRIPKWRFFAGRDSGFEIAGPFECQSGLVGWAEIRRTAEEPRDVLREDVEDFA
jgi:hypothetical protein